MHYTDKALDELETAISDLRFSHIKLVQRMAPFADTLQNERAREYMGHGVVRRLFVLYRCLENMFRLFPPDRAEKLSDDDRSDLEINLHCFLINTYGIIENLGLAIAFENGTIGSEMSERSQRSRIGLFNAKFRRHLHPKLQAYVQSSGLLDWYNSYAKVYRDALVHRIPPYVPPSGLDANDRAEYSRLNEKLATLARQGWSPEYSETMDEIVSLGKASPFYVHSFSEKAKPVYIHPQIIADFRTIEELLIVASANFSWRIEDSEKSAEI